MEGTGLRALRGLQPYFRPYRRALIGGAGAILGSVVVGMATPLLVGGAVDSFRLSPSAATLMTYAGLLIGVAAVRGVFTYLQRMVLVTMSRDIEVDLRDDFFAQLLRLPPSFFQKHKKSTRLNSSH